MNGIAIMLVAATIGVDYGWEPREDGTLDYIIQIEPELYDSLREGGGEIVSEIHPDARNVSRIRIRIGRDELPRVNVDNAPAGAPRADSQVRPASMETDAEVTESAADSPEPVSIRGQSPSANRSFIGSRYESNSNSAAGYNTPTAGVTNSTSNIGSSSITHSPGAASRYGATPSGQSATPVGSAPVGSAAKTHDAYSTPDRLPPQAAAPPLSTDAAATNPSLATPTWRSGEAAVSPTNRVQPRFDSTRSVRDGGYSRLSPNTTAAATAGERQPRASSRPTATQPRSTPTTELGDLREPPSHIHPDGTVHESSTNLPLYGRRPELPPATAPAATQQIPYASAPPLQPAYGAAQGDYAPGGHRAPPTPGPNQAGYTAPYPPATPPGYVTIPAYQLAAMTAAPAAAAPVTPAPVAAAPKDHSLLTTAEEGEKPWPTLVFTIILLFASLGGNLYLGWIAWDFGERYKSIASELRGINLAAG